MWEDPIFEPWSTHAATSADVEATQPHPASVDLLRQIAIPRLEEIGRRLGLARHASSLQDQLDDAPRLLRFELDPWPGPFEEGPPEEGATLEIGPSPVTDDVVTAWYWLQGHREAPDATVSVPAEELSASWIERVILDFVRSVLVRR